VGNETAVISAIANMPMLKIVVRRRARAADQFDEGQIRFFNTTSPKVWTFFQATADSVHNAVGDLKF